MSDSPGSSTKPSEAEASESSSGLRSFLRRATNTQAPSSTTSSEQAPQSRRKGSRLGNIFRSSRRSSVTEEGSSGSPGPSAAQKRRQQVYQAQKRHRNRKAEYEKNLEEEVSRLQHLGAQVNREKDALALQNQAMKSILAAQSIDVQLDAVGLDAPAAEWVDQSALSNANINIRFDEQMGHDRTFVDFMDEDISMFTTSESEAAQSTQSTTSGASPQPHRPALAVKGDSWAALDFILALEWPCQEHTGHAHFNPHPKPMVACEVSGLHGHALTTTSAVYACALPPRAASSGHPSTSSGPSYTSSANTQGQQKRQGLSQESQENWQLSHSEIDKLVALSEKLELDDSEMTPAQAYAAVKDSVPSDQYLRPVLEALKGPLGTVVHCGGLGAILPADIFWQSYEDIVQGLHGDSL